MKGKNGSGKFEVHLVAIDKLNPAPYNPRKMTVQQAKDLRTSIERFGIVDPLVVNRFKGRENIVIGGHQRLGICKLMGITQVPVVFVSLPEAKERELNLRLNRNTGEWDWDLLANFDVPLLRDVGFTDTELARNFDLTLDEVRGADKADDIPDEQAPERVKRGELWLCGDHRLLCGDSTDPKSFARVLDGAKADFVFTSPPYNVDMGYDEHDDKMDRDQYLALIRKVVEQCVAALDAGRFIGWNVGVTMKAMPMRHAVIIEDAGMTAGRQFIWRKPNTGLPLAQREQRVRKLTPNFGHEMVFLFHKGEPAPGSVVELGRMTHDIFDMAAMQATRDIPTVESTKRGPKNNRVKAHPAAFPIALPSEFMRLLTEPGEAVLDPFMGAGTTMLACERSGRRARGIELSPRYCDLALWRWEKLTGREAVKAKANGRAQAAAMPAVAG